MITVETQVTGGQLGRQLQNDPEELAYALVEIADGFPDDIGEEVAANISGDDKDGVIALLEVMLDCLRGEDG
jgi:hypothetical protein